MSDPTVPPAVPVEASTSRQRGYFNQAQLDDLETAESIESAALANAAPLATREITAAFLTRLADTIKEARKRAADALADAADAGAATDATTQAAKALHLALQGIQSAAKQKHLLLLLDGDPTTNFSTDGYLIGSRIQANRAVLLQSAATLILRAREDALPGYSDPATIDAIEKQATDYRNEKSTGAEAIKTKELSRLTRDDLMALLNTMRSATQHAADALWPWSVETNRPIRKLFSLPLTRPMGL